MRDQLLELLRHATPEMIADAVYAGIDAAYTSTRQHGYAAALEVLKRAELEPEPEPTEAAAETEQPTE